MGRRVWIGFTSLLAGLVYGLSGAGYAEGIWYTFGMLVVTLMVAAYIANRNSDNPESQTPTNVSVGVVGGLLGFGFMAVAINQFWWQLPSPYDVPWHCTIDFAAPWSWGVVGSLLVLLGAVRLPS
jgi:hypothetical protein